MSGEINIQTLFARLRLEHLLAYLPANGWLKAGEGHADRVRFELAHEPTPYVVLLPRSSGTPQGGKLLRAAIYTLCDVLDLQPAEVIHQILATELPQASPPSNGVKVRLRLSNGDSHQTIALGIGSRPLESMLMPGEALEIMAESAEDGICQINIRTLGG